MTPRREKLVLTLTPDPALAHLARRVALHFFIQHGLGGAESRKKSRIIERRCRALLRSRPAARGRRSAVPAGGRSWTLTLIAGTRRLEVFGRRQGGPGPRRMLGLERPARPRPPA